MMLLDRLSVAVNPDGFEIIGGCLLVRLSSFLELGEIIEADGLSVEVLEVEARWIREVRVHCPALEALGAKE
mgnify:CR=1 FL=1